MVAVKIGDSNKSESDVWQDFIKEVKNLLSIKSPKVVMLLGVSVDVNPSIILELVEG